MKMKAFQDFGKVMIRTPSYSYDILFDENGNAKNIDELIWEFLDDEKFLESIYWSSIPLYKTIINLKNKELSDVRRIKILLTLKKYLIRASTRPTPYGTFAGTAIQSLKNDSEENYFDGKNIRLDVNIIRKIIRSIEENTSFSPFLSYELNSTLYSFDNQFRYLEIDKKEGKTAKISSLERNRVLNFIYSKGKKNKIIFDSIFSSFSEYFDEYEFREFFQELIESGFLVSELELSQTDNDELKYIREFIEKDELKNFSDTLLYLNMLNSVSDYISGTENLFFGDFNEKKIQNILDVLKQLKITVGDDQIFHVDVLTQKNNAVKLSEKNLKNLYEAVSVLSKITLKDNSESLLQKFQKVFSEKYDTASVPLMEVLDPEIGIGFPANANVGSFSHNDFINFTQKKIDDKRKNKQNLSDWLIDEIENLSPTEAEIKIMPSDLHHIPDRTVFLSNSFNVLGQIISPEKIVLKSVGGVHANTLLSRFAYMNEEIQTLCSDITDYEKQVSKEVIFAEIVWIPEGREANITRRLSYTDYEIPIYYKSSLPKKNQIALDDILVSIENNEIILTSKQLKKRIIPRLSSAYNYSLSNNSVYKFLCSLQDQKSINLILMPDFVTSKKRFFPRITYKNIILHQSCWIFQETDIISIRTSKTPLDDLKFFFKKWNVATFVLLCQGDNELFLDISNECYLDILLAEIYKNNDIIVLKEWLYDTDNPNNYISEFILPLRKNMAVPYEKSLLKNSFKEVRNIYPGEEWLYFKLYCDANYSDSIIKTIFKKVIKKLETTNVIEKWFFIRFLDPHYHLRLRIQVKSVDTLGKVINLINESISSFVQKKSIWKINLDTYNRELERYSYSAIDHAEYAFYKDSELYAKLLTSIYFQEDISIRIFAAVKNVNFWLELFNFDFKAKRDFCENMKNLLAHEQSEEFLKETENKYRKYQELLYTFIKNDKFETLFKQRNRDLGKIHLDSRNLQEFIHMSINRWFITNQRNWEFLVYYFCQKYYNRCLYSSSSQKIIDK